GTERERWFAFRSERLRVFMEAWLSAHGLAPIARPVWATETPPEGPISQDALSARRKSSAEALRKQLRELADTLGARDLEKVTVFAEFVKARRAARGFAHRPDASGTAAETEHSEPEAGAGAPLAAPAETKAAEDDEEEEEATPSSRKRPAAR
ncbi:MAG TPA: hypothetical protein VGM44_14535, partial [Polyangiaceae bacterium]